MTITPEQRITLHGFNNLTKSLSFNMYDICYTKTKEEREAYIEYIDEQYNSDRLTAILKMYPILSVPMYSMLLSRIMSLKERA